MDFEAMLAGLRENDFAAEHQFVREYQVHTVRAARNRLRSSPATKELSAEDLNQMTLLDFFCFARAGRVTSREPAELAALLTTIVRRIVSHAERDGVSALRDARRNEALAIENLAIRSREPDPSEAAADKEIRELCLAELSEEERRILRERFSGTSFVKIAEGFGLTADAARMRFNRAFAKLSDAYQRLVPKDE